MEKHKLTEQHMVKELDDEICLAMENFLKKANNLEIYPMRSLIWLLACFSDKINIILEEGKDSQDADFLRKEIISLITNKRKL